MRGTKAKKIRKELRIRGVSISSLFLEGGRNAGKGRRLYQKIKSDFHKEGL